jgi:hypothetical protein
MGPGLGYVRVGLGFVAAIVHMERSGLMGPSRVFEAGGWIGSGDVEWVCDVVLHGLA